MTLRDSKRRLWDRDTDGLRLVLTDSVVQYIERQLPLRKSFGNHENVLYIAGLILSSVRVGLTVIAPRCVTGSGFYYTDADTHAMVMSILHKHRLHLVAQVHCHPGSRVSHSGVDDDKAIVRADGHWSIVVPHYGRHGVLPLRKCGIHCYKQGDFQRLSNQAVAARVLIAPAWVDLRGGIL